MKKAKQNNKTLKLLRKISTIVIILLLSLISFVGIYVKDKNTMKNVIPEYKLGTDLYGARNILIKVDDSTTTKKYDSDGNLVKDSSDGDENNENITEVEEKVNPDELRTADNYEAVKNIIEARLKYMKVEDYLLRFDESTGDISLEVSENSNTDYIAQYTITKGEFKIVDNDTSEVLLTNADLKEAKVQYSTSTSGTTVYLTIEFNQDAVEKLRDISKTYVSSTDTDGNTTTKKIKMTLDDSTIITTYFQEEISTGIIQLSMGTSTSTSEIQTNIQSASNMAVLLNTDPMPLTYASSIKDLTSAPILSPISSPKTNISFCSFPWKSIGPKLSLIPYLVTISLAIFVATSISLLAPVEISSRTNFSAALPPSNATNFSFISVLEI